MTQSRKRKNEAALDLGVIESISIDDPLESHFLWNTKNNVSKIRMESNKILPRIHSISRILINVSVFVNLFRRYQNEDALLLTNEDIKLIQIAILYSAYFDMSKTNEEPELWEKTCGLQVYFHLIQNLGVDKRTAINLAEAIANRHQKEGQYFELCVDVNNDMNWVAKTSQANLIQKIVHDSFRLDEIRSPHYNFHAENLFFYKMMAINDDIAYEEIAKLITEARSLIALHWSARRTKSLKILSAYEYGEMYHSTIFELMNAAYLLYFSLFSYGNILDSSPLNEIFFKKEYPTEYKTVNDETLTAAMNNGHLLARAVASPAATPFLRKKDLEKGAEIEIRKMLRMLGVATSTRKFNNKLKRGNPNRSVSLITSGASVYAGQGFFILNPNICDFVSISHQDNDTGRGKKRRAQSEKMSYHETLDKIAKLVMNQQLGGTTRNSRYCMDHNEIEYNITKVDAIYFTQDPTLYNEMYTGKRPPCNKFTHYLQALYLQQLYKRETGVELPIFEYSGKHNSIKAVPSYSDDQIIEMWVEIISKLIKTKIRKKHLISESLDELKIEAIDGVFHRNQNSFTRKQFPIDILYSASLSNKLNNALITVLMTCLMDHQKAEMQDKFNLSHSRDILFQKQPALYPNNEVNESRCIASHCQRGFEIIRKQLGI